MKVDQPPADQAERPVHGGASQPDGDICLRIVEEGRNERVVQLAAYGVRAGRGFKNDVVLHDKLADDVHFEVVLDAIGFRLRDLGSAAGTFVDGCRVMDVYIRPGSRIRVGSTQIFFQPLKPTTDPSILGSIVGHSPAISEMRELLVRLAACDLTVLIEGESGTGKELVARAIHGASRRAGGPFLVLDCGAVPLNLFESELFGHEKGAFTGAAVSRLGILEKANRGTLFLDEVGELPLALQPKILRAIERREARRVGGDRDVRSDVRIVAATNRDLEQEVAHGAFREDVYFRLAVARVCVPPLRDRPEDIPVLVRHLLQQVLPRDPGGAHAVFSSIDTATWRKLEQHYWRGNVRELRNVVERGVVLGALTAPEGNDVMPTSAQPPTPPEGVIEVDLNRPFLSQRKDIISAFEKHYLTGLLRQNGGKLSRAAAAAQLDRAYFKRLLRRHV